MNSIRESLIEWKNEASGYTRCDFLNGKLGEMATIDSKGNSNSKLAISNNSVSLFFEAISFHIKESCILLLPPVS